MRISLHRWTLCAVLSAALAGGCASSTLKGTSPDGRKTYLGPVPIENTEAFRQLMKSPQNDVSIQTYLFARLKAAQDLQYYRDGQWYSWLEAYRGGMWLMRNRYQKGQDARTFIKNHVWRSEATGQAHLVKFPDGSIHEAYYVLLNELDLLEQTLRSASPGKSAAA